LIFFARLESAVEEAYVYKKAGLREIPSEFIQGMSAPLASLQSIASEIKELRGTASDAKVAAEASRSIAIASISIAGVAIAIAIAMGTQLFQSINAARAAAEAKIQSQAQLAPMERGIGSQCLIRSCVEDIKPAPAKTQSTPSDRVQK
jgi:hypothetical protein